MEHGLDKIHVSRAEMIEKPQMAKKENFEDPKEQEIDPLILEEIKGVFNITGDPTMALSTEELSNVLAKAPKAERDNYIETGLQLLWDKHKQEVLDYLNTYLASPGSVLTMEELEKNKDKANPKEVLGWIKQTTSGKRNKEQLH